MGQVILPESKNKAVKRLLCTEKNEFWNKLLWKDKEHGK